jgi:hypothetical protein
MNPRVLGEAGGDHAPSFGLARHPRLTTRFRRNGDLRTNLVRDFTLAPSRRSTGRTPQSLRSTFDVKDAGGRIENWSFARLTHRSRCGGGNGDRVVRYSSTTSARRSR